MSELKGILKRIINHEDEEYISNRLSEVLNEYCPSKYVWHHEGNRLMIEISLDEQDEIIKFIEDLVDCSYINEFDENTEILTLSFTVSTLIKKLENVTEGGYPSVKMDRFIKYQNKDKSSREHHVYVMDHRMLVDEVFSKGYADNGIIFTASSPSEWVNHEIVDTVLELLNTERSFTQMIDNCMKKDKK